MIMNGRIYSSLERRRFDRDSGSNSNRNNNNNNNNSNNNNNYRYEYVSDNNYDYDDRYAGSDNNNEYGKKSGYGHIGYGKNGYGSNLRSSTGSGNRHSYNITKSNSPDIVPTEEDVANDIGFVVKQRYHCHEDGEDDLSRKPYKHVDFDIENDYYNSSTTTASLKEADNRMNGRLHHQRKNVTTATAANNYESLMGKVDCWDKEDDDVDGLYERNASNDRNKSSSISNSNANSKISNNYHQQGYYPVKQDVVVVSTCGNREASSSLLKTSASGSAAIVTSLHQDACAASDVDGAAAGKYENGCCWLTTSIDRTRYRATSTRSFFLIALLAILLLTLLFAVGSLIYFNNVPYNVKESYVQDPCVKMFCSHGATCIVESTGKAICKCPMDCPVTETPVCGTDGVTYKNLCSLRSTACHNQLNIRVQYPGECNLPDPCRGHVCPYGAKCVPTTVSSASSDGRTAVCECPSRCPNYGDHLASRPVCASNGLDYRNLCEMNKASCLTNTNLTIKYEGYCDPCSSKQCPHPEICLLDPDRNAVCSCSELCPSEFSPICGSDGKTYSNECAIRRQSCYSKKNLRTVYRGKCSSGVNPCASVNCKQNEECLINKFGIAACECISDCEPIVRPVCSLDGITYDSICHLRQTACRLNANITFGYRGVCGSDVLCANRKCEYYSQCVPKNNQSVCECPICDNEFEPICGSDGITYENQCKLELESCRSKKDIRTLYTGLCDGCENKKCQYNSICESTGSGDAKCICPINCTKENAPVCGSDGITYDNECQLKRTSCLSEKPITISYIGNCDTCQNVRCKYGARCESGICVCPTDCSKDLSVSVVIDEPVCASDMNTYSSECELQKYACLNSISTLNVLFYGDCKERIDSSLLITEVPNVEESSFNSTMDHKEICQDIQCEFDGTCEAAPDGFPRCSCIFECPANSTRPVCGSDLQLYPSVCHMKMKACQKQEEIRLRPLDLCQGMEIKPCNGKKPVVDRETSLEINCGNGPNRKDCPSGSYCHQTPNFAKCCTKDSGVYIASCQDSWYGCCPDNKTSAQGPDDAGCPSLCGCNKLGSALDYCDPVTGHCKCKPGVGGEKCDRCEPGFWGLPKISSGHPGCLPCGCSLFGSVRDDCEQMTGRCVCKAGVEGPKCTVCTDANKTLGPNGCISIDTVTPAPTSCDNLSCYFGAVCEVKDGIAKCICHISCSQEYDGQTQAVCGNDGQTYSSECQLKLYSCRYQKDIAVQALSSCTDDYVSEIDLQPKLGAWTSVTVQTEDSNSRISKSTRHVLTSELQNGYVLNRNTNKPRIINANYLEKDLTTSDREKEVYKFINDPLPATSRPLIGDFCNSSGQCKIDNSQCSFGFCVCKDNFTVTEDREACSGGLALPIVQSRCSSSPCQNNGICENKPYGQFVCRCVHPYIGQFCEQSSLAFEDISIPAFSGQSYMVLKQLKAYHKFSVEIEFKSYTSNGILLYSQQHVDGAGDFISLALVNGLIEFRYNLGNGQAILRSVQHLSVNSYHRVVAKRYQRDGILQVDNYESVAGQSEGTLRALDLNENAYVGYMPAISNKVFENIGTNVGLVGCIRRLKIGRHVVDLKERQTTIIEKIVEVKECANITKCDESKGDSCVCSGSLCEIEANPCLSHPCQFGSTCEALLQGSYVCKCLPGYRGNNCEIFKPDSDDFYIPQFNGVDSYIKFPCLEGAKRYFSIEIWFMPLTGGTGMLLYNGQITGRKGDFISVNMINERIQFRYDLGSGIANITTNNKIKRNDWNVVRVNRFDRTGTIQLNNGDTVKGTSGPILNELNLELPLYIAGMPSFNEANYDSGVSSRFSGAIQRILINGKPMRLKSDGEDYNVEPYLQHVCFARNERTCLNGGQCIPYFMSYICKCPSKFTGFGCENYTGSGNIDAEEGIRLNGNTYLYYAPTSKQQLPELHARFVNTSLLTSGGDIDGTDNNYYTDGNDNDDGDGDGDGDDDDNNEQRNSEESIDDDMYDENVDYDFFYNRPKSRKVIYYEFSIKTTQMNGLLLWCSRLRQSQRDYIALAIINGSVEFAHGFGKEQEVIYLRSKEIVSDGNWHTVWIQHKRRLTQLRIDDNKPLKLLTNYQQKLFMINSKIFIGNIPNIRLEYPIKYRVGYQGCLRNLQIDKKKVSLLQLQNNSPVPIQLCQENDVL